MLWTDARFVTTADLLTVDPEVLDVATAENIVIDGTSGIAQRTIEIGQQQLLAQMQRFGGYLSSGLVSANHLAAVFNVGGPGVNRTRILMSQVVAWDQFTPVVKTWMLYKTLEKFFHAAFSRTLNDRYAAKMKQYAADERFEHWPNLKNIGLPIVYRYMNTPGAVNERHAGTWGSSNVTYSAVGGALGGTFDVAVTFVDQTFYINAANKYNAESCPSATVTITVPAGNAISVNLDGLIPPNAGSNAADMAQALATPLNASGWNIYAAPTGTPLVLQNSAPIPTPPLGSTTYYGNSGYANTVPLSNTTPYVLAGDPATGVVYADQGQFADAYFTCQDVLQRG